MTASVGIVRLGLVPYLKALDMQNTFASMLKTKALPWSGGVLLLLEHPPVYTVGIRRKSYGRTEEERLKKLGAEFIETNRGGLITFHGPGQLMAYPVLDLKKFQPSMRWYVDCLEELVLKLCEYYGLKGSRSPHTGVWIGENKVCAIGVHGSRFVTTHGLALNCSTDLSWFDHIVPCGIVGKGVTSLTKELSFTVTPDKVLHHFLSCFQEQFQCDIFDANNIYDRNIITVV